MAIGRGKLKMVAVRLTADLARDLRVYAAQRDKSVQEVVERAVAAIVRHDRH
jgi:2-keto-3-deoxy-L-rhamnonate aldolase RhmA